MVSRRQFSAIQPMSGAGGMGGHGVKRPLIDARDVFRRGGPKATRLDPSLTLRESAGVTEAVDAPP